MYYVHNNKKTEINFFNNNTCRINNQNQGAMVLRHQKQDTLVRGLAESRLF